MSSPDNRRLDLERRMEEEVRLLRVVESRIEKSSLPQDRANLRAQAQRIRAWHEQHLAEYALLVDQPPLDADSGRAGRLTHLVPVSRPDFTGRDNELIKLRKLLADGDDQLAPIAISGAPGVGKSQLAAEYAHQWHSEYDLVCWVSGSTPTNFRAQLSDLANGLDPPVTPHSDAVAQFMAVREWFCQNGHWLMIVDDAENVSELASLLPLRGDSRIVLIVRSGTPLYATATLDVGCLDEIAGALMLLRRAELLEGDADLSSVGPQIRGDAIGAARDLGGLPLAIELAGACMKARSLSPGGYLRQLRQRRQALYRRYSTAEASRIDAGVLVALDHLEQSPSVGPVAAELVRICAFLAPSPIPYDVFLEGASELGRVFQVVARDEIAFADVYAVASRYALIGRDIYPPAINMHPLVRAAIVENMREEERAAWRERLVRTLNSALPSVENWPVWERLLPHLRLALETIEADASTNVEATRLMRLTSRYLDSRGLTIEAERFTIASLNAARRAYPSIDPRLAVSLNDLAELYIKMGRLSDSAPLLEEALSIRRSSLSTNHPSVASSLTSLAQLYFELGRYSEVEPLLREALAITRASTPGGSGALANSIEALANFYSEMEQFDEAEPLALECLAIRRATLAADDSKLASALVRLADVYRGQGRFVESSPLYSEAIAIKRGGTPEDLAAALYNLALVQRAQQDNAAAEPLFHEALTIRLSALPPDHPDVANSLNSLAGLYMATGRLAEAEPLYEQALHLRRTAPQPDEALLAASLNNLGHLRLTQGRANEAEPLFRESLEILFRSLGAEHPWSVRAISNYARTLEAIGRFDDARELIAWSAHYVEGERQDEAPRDIGRHQLAMQGAG